ncbi:MAG: aminodeoxychorismate synthase component I [Akkermansiaceae bacterium]
MKELICREITLEMLPVEVARKLSHLEGVVFFDSSGNLPENYENAVSIIAADPVKVIKGEGCDFSEIRSEMVGYEVKFEGEDLVSCPFGGAFGWVDYSGEFCFGIYESCLFYMHDREQWYEIGDLSSRVLDNELLDFEIGDFTAHTERDAYISGVKRVQDYIRAGDIYQVNLTQKFSAKVKSGSLFSLYDSLRTVAPAPMSAYMSFANREVLSSSPETFLKMDGRRVETRPIKGTRPRYEDEELDKDSAKELMESAKERAELVMITDLERNDLGRVCEFGSVKVDEMLKLEKLEHVYHLVSRVSGELRDGVDHWQVLEECFPGGSITGAPKKRAMEIIAELETEARGLYTGAVGYIGFNQVSQFNIVIRTLVREDDILHYHVGAGIVADSDAVAEYEETLHKAKGIRFALDLSGR